VKAFHEAGERAAVSSYTVACKSARPAERREIGTCRSPLSTNALGEVRVAFSMLSFSAPSYFFALASASPQRLRRVTDALPLTRVMPIEQGGAVRVS
jgi:hypothetical protein